MSWVYIAAQGPGEGGEPGKCGTTSQTFLPFPEELSLSTVKKDLL